MNINEIVSNLSTGEIILAIIFITSSLSVIFYYTAIFSRLLYFREKVGGQPVNEAVSVIISARNEDYNLQHNLPKILEQNYHDFEVIVVNHASNDDSAMILMEMQNQYSNLKVITIEQDLNFFSGKKFPLSIGIKSAKNDLLLLTDADCIPATENWIQSMVNAYCVNTEVVLGYGPYKKEKGLLNTIIRYDTLMIAIQYFSFALVGNPYMGVGRNLSYRKSLFMKNNGFISHLNIPSGDDDLFIKQVSNKRNTCISVNSNSFVYSDAKNNFGNWIRQKKRHFSTGSKYSFSVKILLGFFSLSQVLFYISLILLLALKTLIIPVAILGIITICARVIIQKKAAYKFSERQLLLFSLIGDIFYVLILPIITIRGLTGKQKTWK